MNAVYIISNNNNNNNKCGVTVIHTVKRLATKQEA